MQRAQGNRRNLAVWYGLAWLGLSLAGAWAEGRRGTSARNIRKNPPPVLAAFVCGR